MVRGYPRGIVLLGLQKGLDELWCDQSHVVPKTAQHSRPIVRSPCGFHPYQAGRQLSEELRNLPSPQPPSQNCCFPTIYSVDLEYILGNVEPNYTHFDGHRSLLPRR
jgi:hypothetical protein